MRKSSESSLPPLDEDVDWICSDDLLGSQSRAWLGHLRLEDAQPEGRPVNDFGPDGLFVDHHFPRGELEMRPGIIWKRPKEICASPKFIVDGVSRLDIYQGQINDCWFLSTIASLAMNPSLLNKVVPLGQSFQGGYNGCFTFRFWQYGQWEEVKIDDTLPTLNNDPIFLKSPQRNEFWSSLLEKAYAKLKGGYKALEMGCPHEAMVDMTGGVTEALNVPSMPKHLPAFLRYLLAKGALINCANRMGTGKANELNIMFNHAYSVTAVEKVETVNGIVDLVRILNPWGNTEWKGPWSDVNGLEWETVSAKEQRRLKRKSLNDGEFWMSISDFRYNFDLIEVCYLLHGPTGNLSSPWSCIMHHGMWEPGISAGGSPQGENFWQNPQFNFTLSEVDRDTDDPQKHCSFLLALMQKMHVRRGNNLSIALHVYQAHPKNAHLSRKDLSEHHPVLCSPQYLPRREITLRGSLPPGHYIIIPSTSNSSRHGDFLLRVLTEKGNAATLAPKPPQQISPGKEISRPHQAALPPPKATRELFKKYSDKKGLCKPVHLHRLLTEALKGGVLAGCEKYMALEHCKSLVVLMDVQGNARLNWNEFQGLWDKITRWTDIFLVFDKNKSKRLEYNEAAPALKAAGIAVDELIMGLVGLRYTDPDMTISYPGFLYMLMKLESMIQKFQEHDTMDLGTITMTYRQWLNITMYN